MQPIPPTTQAFDQSQLTDFSVEYWDTAYTPLEGDVASGGIVMNVRNPIDGVDWDLADQLRALSPNGDIAAAFAADVHSEPDITNGRIENLISYWAGGAPGWYGAQTQGQVAFHFKCVMRPVNGRSWWSSAATPTWFLALAGSGYVRITQTVGGVRSIVFAGSLSEESYLTDGFKFSAQISTMAAGDSLDIAYVQEGGETFGGFVVKAVLGTLGNAKANNAAAAAAPVLGCGLMDDGTPPAKRTITGVRRIETDRGVKKASMVTFDLPLINTSETDGVGWEYHKASTDDPGVLRLWSNGSANLSDPTKRLDLKRNRLVRVTLGFKNEPYRVFTGFVDDFPVTGNVAQVRCLGYEHRLLDRFDKNYPDRISYMAAGYRKLKGTTQPVFDVTAYDNWPLEAAVSDLLLRGGVDPSRLVVPRTVPLTDGTTVPVVLPKTDPDGTTHADAHLKLRARTVSGNQLRIERPVHYGNSRQAFTESTPVDDEYITKPENTKELWNRLRDLTERYGYDLYFDEVGDVVLAPRNNPSTVYDFVTGDASGGTATQKVNPSAYRGTFIEFTGAPTVTKAVTGARIDVCFPRLPGLLGWSVNVKRAADNLDMGTTLIDPVADDEEFFYDFRTAVDGTNATIATVFTGQYGQYVVTLTPVGGAGTRRLDCVFTFHTDPANPLPPSAFSTAKNALSVAAKSASDDHRNFVIVVGRRKAAITDSAKLFNSQNPENPESEYVVAAAVDAASVADPTAVNFAGYPKESVIYNSTITDQDFAEWTARTFIYRQRLPKPSAPIEHTLAPFVQLRDPVFAVEDRFKTITGADVLYVTNVRHVIDENHRATTTLETTSYPEFPAYEPRDDIDIDAFFDHHAVWDIDVNYISLDGQLVRNAPVADHTDSTGFPVGGGPFKAPFASTERDIKTFDVSVSGNAGYIDWPNWAVTPLASQPQLNMAGQPWPPVPGTFFVKPATGIVNAMSTNGTVNVPRQEAIPMARAAIPPFQVSNVQLDKDGKPLISLVRCTFWRQFKGEWIKDFTVDARNGGPWTAPLHDVAAFWSWDIETELMTISLATFTFHQMSVDVTYQQARNSSNADFDTNTPQKHLFNLDYRDTNRKAYLVWNVGDRSVTYQRSNPALGATVNQYTVRYRAFSADFRAMHADGSFKDPYAGHAPFYDPYTSELGYLVNLSFTALVSGNYRVSIRNLDNSQIVAWLTEPTADPDNPESHWTYLTAGKHKQFSWDGIDQLGNHNRLQSDEWANVAHGAFEQDQKPLIGKGFYVWNEETRAGFTGAFAVISGQRDAATGRPVFGVGHYAGWYVYFETVNDRLQDVAEQHTTSPDYQVPRKLATRTDYKKQSPTGLSPYITSDATAAMVWTHLPDPSLVELDVSDWTGAGKLSRGSTADYDATIDPEVDNPDNWVAINDAAWATANPDAVINNQRPVRVRFHPVQRPGALWAGHRANQSFKLNRMVHAKGLIFDNFVVWSGGNFAGTDIEDRTVVTRRLANDAHTIVFKDDAYRDTTSLREVDFGGGSEWIFTPNLFKKDFRGIADEPIQFMDYLQLEEVPRYDPSRAIANGHSRFQLAFMSYLFYLSAYTSDRSGRMTWCLNPRFLDRSKLLRNVATDWWEPGAPGTPATDATYRAEWPEDRVNHLRRSIIARQWTDELDANTGTSWKAGQITRYGLAGTIGEQLLKHKWKDNDPRATTINGMAWNTFYNASVEFDDYSARLIEKEKLALAVFPAAALGRQIKQGGLGSWTWEQRPLWKPSPTRDFHPYFMIPPMADFAPGGAVDSLTLHYVYGTVDGSTYNAKDNTGADAARLDTWQCVTWDMTEPAGTRWATFADVLPSQVVQNSDPAKQHMTSNILNYIRQEEMQFYEDYRGIWTRKARPAEAPAKVTPVSPYYVNSFWYETFNWTSQRGQVGTPRYTTPFPKGWFNLSFRAEYVWESASMFPTDRFGRPRPGAFNAAIAAVDKALTNAAFFDSGAYIGWKDDYPVTGLTDVNYKLHFRGQTASDGVIEGQTDVYNSPRMPVAVGPQLPVTRDVYMHLVLVNERREDPLPL